MRERNSLVYCVQNILGELEFSFNQFREVSPQLAPEDLNADGLIDFECRNGSQPISIIFF